MVTRIDRRRALAAVGAALGMVAVGPVAELEAQGALKFELYKDARGAFRWRLKAANGRVVATSSEGYTTKANCRAGIDLVKRGAAGAEVEEVG